MPKMIKPFCISLAFSFVLLGVEPTIDTGDVLDSRGEHAFTVTNRSSQSLTGMVLRVDRQPPGFNQNFPGWFFYDSVLNHFQPALEQGQSYTFHVGSDDRDVHPMKISVETAIFSDGSALGEPEAIRSLWNRRELGFAEYREALELADRSMTDPTDRAGAIKALTDLKQKRMYDTSRPIEERMAVSTAFSTVIDNLTTASSNVSADSIIAGIRKKEADREAAFRKQPVPAQVQRQ